MNYLRSLFLNFLIVFFIDRVSPGVEIQNYENVPNIGADILFSLIVGFFNASVYFFFALMEMPISNLKIGIITFIISFSAFIIIAIVPFGVRVVNPWGVIIGGLVVWLVAFMTNHLEWKHYNKV
ncbi:MAG: phage holin family protein [Parachlamydiales bacterium]|nr:phage holin family protein [Parachlamydiales bacterium]